MSKLLQVSSLMAMVGGQNGRIMAANSELPRLNANEKTPHLRTDRNKKIRVRSNSGRGRGRGCGCGRGHKET